MDEIALSAALEIVAVGGTRADAGLYLSQNCGIDAAIIPVILRDARIEAENQGVERDDIDDSWYTA